MRTRIRPWLGSQQLLVINGHEIKPSELSCARQAFASSNQGVLDPCHSASTQDQNKDDAMFLNQHSFVQPVRIVYKDGRH